MILYLYITLSVLIFLILKVRKRRSPILPLLLKSVGISVLLTTIFGSIWVYTSDPTVTTKTKFLEDNLVETPGPIKRLQIADSAKFIPDTISGVTIMITKTEFPEMGGLWWIGTEKIISIDVHTLGQNE